MHLQKVFSNQFFDADYKLGMGILNGFRLTAYIKQNFVSSSIVTISALVTSSPTVPINVGTSSIKDFL